MRIRIAAIGMLLLLTAMAAAAVQNGNDLYQQGLARETAGDIRGAMQIFERIVRDFSSNRSLSARALLQLGRLSELLDQDQARRYYERVVREFAGQPAQSELLAQAKSRLQALASMPPESKRTGMTVRPFSEINAELEAISPDGTKAIVMDYSKGQNLALFEFASRKKRLLTDLNVLMGTASFPVWSPDSRRVAFERLVSRLEQMMEPVFELRVMTLDGQSNVVYRSEEVSGLQPVGWTPDGATLAVVITRPDRTWALGTLPAAGGSFTALRSFAWSYRWSDATPRLSRDGRFIAYLEGEKGQRDVHVVSIDGRDTHRITDDPGDDFAPMWSPDGGRLAFTSNRLGVFSLWTVEVKDGKPVGSAVKLKDGMQSTFSIDWTERGILYHQLNATLDLYTAPMDPSDGHPTGSPRLIPYSRTGRNVSPVWSPDGGRLAFVSSAAAHPDRQYVVVMPVDGGQTREFLIPTTIWANPRAPLDLRWFGDGRGLGLSGTDTRGGPAVFRLLLETGEWDTIRLPEQEYRIWNVRDSRRWTVWNTDGTAFYFTRLRSSDAGIFERATNGTAERPVYRPSAPVITITSLEFGPDRKSLAFEERTAESNSRRRTRIVVLDVETGKTRTVIEDVIGLTNSWPLNLMGWTPSGDLLVRRYLGNFIETLVVPVNGGPPRSIAIPTFNPTQAPFAKWSPDGLSMVLSRVDGGWETFVIENPLAAIRATAASR